MASTLGQPFPGDLEVTGVRRGLREVADGHSGEIRMMGRIGGIEEPSGESQRLGMVTDVQAVVFAYESGLVRPGSRCQFNL